MRRTLLFSLLAACCFSLHINAQAVNGNDSMPSRTQLLLENRAANSRLTELNDSISQLTGQIAEAQANRDSLRDLLKAEADKDILVTLKNKRDSLNTEKGKLLKPQNASDVNAGDGVDASQQDDTEGLAAELRRRDGIWREQIKGNKRVLTDMGAFREIWVRQQAAAVDTKWLSVPYSQIQVAELNLMIEQFNDFAGKDKTVAAAIPKLQAIADNCNIYAEAVKTISRKYSAADVAKYEAAVQKLSVGASGDRASELTALSWRLRHFSDCIDLFKEVIAAVDKVDGVNNYAAAKKVINQMETDDEYKSTIVKIPWLGGLFGKYEQALREHDSAAVDKIKVELDN